MEEEQERACMVQSNEQVVVAEIVEEVYIGFIPLVISSFFGH